MVKRDPTALTRAALGPAKSLLGSFVVITLTRLLLEVADQLCVGIVQAAGETTESMGDKITILAGDLAATNIAAPGVGAIITTFLAGLAITAAAVVWLSLLVRKALLLVAIVFASLALSGFSWDATRGWIPKWAMFVATPICSLPNSTPPTAASTPITATTPTRGPTLTTPSTCSPTALKCAHGDNANRRLYNQALFTKIYIDEDDRLRVEDNRPFEMLLAPEISAKRPYLGPRQQQGPNRNHRRWQGLRASCVGWS